MEPIRVLMVEDNPADVELATEVLGLDKLHIDLTVASSGEEALRLLDETEANQPMPVDVILLDLNLPGISGRDVLAALKSDPRQRLLPVVILTSSDAERDMVETYDLGANAYVTKPIGLQAFRAAVTAIDHFWFTVVGLPKGKDSDPEEA